MSREMKDSGIEWIGEIPKYWEVVKTKSVFSNYKEIVGDKVDDYERLSLTLNGVLKRSKDDANGLQPLKFEGYQILKENQLVFKLIDLENVNTSRVGLSPYTGIVSPAYIILDNEKVSKFGFYYFLSMWHREIFNKLGGDGVRSNLNIKDLLKIPYVLTNKEEQQKIVDFLDKKVYEIDKIINETTISIEEYKKYRQSIITDAVTKGLNSNAEMKDSRFEHIGLIPINWQVIKLKYLLEERNIKSITGTEEPLSMSQKYGLIKTKDMDKIPNIASSFIGNKHVEIGDLVFNKLKAHLGVFAVSEYNGLVSPDYAVYYSKENKNLNVKFLEYLFKTDRYINEFKKYSKGVGAGLTRLYTSDLFNIRCSIPKIDEQNLIVEFINNKCKKINTLITQKETLLTELESYKKSLIYECVTGKREV